MTLCNVQEWILEQQAISDIPSVERVYKAVVDAHAAAIEASNKDLLATVIGVAEAVGLSPVHAGDLLRRLRHFGRVQQIRAGKMFYYVPVRQP